MDISRSFGCGNAINEEFFSELLKAGLKKAVDKVQNADSDFSNMVRYMKNGDYRSAAKLATKKGISANTEFKNVTVFGRFSHTFSSIKGGMACLAAATSDAADISEITDRMHDAFIRLFLDGGFGGKETFEQKCDEAHIYKDCVSFILTKDGHRVPKAIDVGEVDMVKFFNEIRVLSGGTYTVSSFPLIRILVDGRFTKTIQTLCDYDMIKFTDGMETMFNNGNADIVDILKTKAPHRFRLHEPEVKYDSVTGKIVRGGSLYDTFNAAGYAMDGEDGQTVNLNNVYRIIEHLLATYNRYSNSNENIVGNPFDKELSGVSDQINNFRFAVEKHGVDDESASSAIRSIKERISISVNNLLGFLKLPKVNIDFPQFSNALEFAWNKDIVNFDRSWGKVGRRTIRTATSKAYDDGSDRRKGEQRVEQPKVDTAEKPRRKVNRKSRHKTGHSAVQTEVSFR